MENINRRSEYKKMKHRLAPRLPDGVRFITVPEHLYQRAIRIKKLMNDLYFEAEFGDSPKIHRGNSWQEFSDYLDNKYKELCYQMISRYLEDE